MKKIFAAILSMLMLLSLNVTAFAAPVNSVTINNTTLEFDEIIYVSVNGNDATGDGTEANPFLTVKKAKASLIGDNSCIFLNDEGNYKVGALTGALSNNRADTKLTYIANPEYAGDIIAEISAADSSRNYYETLYIGLVFYKTSGDGRVVLDYNHNGTRYDNKFYNCVFKTTSSAIVFMYHTNNSGLSNNLVSDKYYNCVVDCTTTGFVYENRELAADDTFGAVNSVTKYSYDPKVYETVNNFTFTTGLTGASFDENYNITMDESLWKNVGTGTNPDGTQANLGVYGGEFAWNFTGSVNPPQNNNKLHVLLDVDETAQLSIATNLSKNLDLNWRSSDETVATVDANGVVTAKAFGEAKIYAESDDGTYSDFIPVKVLENADEYRLALDLETGKNARLWFSDSENITWTSMDESVVTVSSSGRLTAISNGLAIVEATDGTTTKLIYVRVR